MTLYDIITFVVECSKEVKTLANIKSALKRIKITKFKTLRNKMIMSSLKTQIKKYEEAMKANDFGTAKDNLLKAIVQIDKAASKGTINKNAASRKKSRLTKRLNAAV